MQRITLEQVADYLETATIQHTHDLGHAIVHIGVSAAGSRFALMNDMHGNSTLSEGM